ncbi:MAG TPA: HD domain-containing phosphohydrolase [Actinomycetota bacterium]|nr:HD domain-containing phosphohydrolase [Actinomycetota bacterium]
MQRPSDPAIWGDRALAAVAAVVAVVLIPFAQPAGFADALFTFGAFVLLTELLDTELPSGKRLRLSLAPGLAFAMLEGTRAGSASAAVAGLTFLAAACVAGGIRALAKREVRFGEIAASFLTVTAAAAAYDALAGTGPLHLTGRDGTHLASVTGMIAVLAIALAFEPARLWVTGAVDPVVRRARSPMALLRALRSNAALQSAIVSVAALVALAFPKLGGWSFPLFLGPLAATRYAFRQITQIRTTEVQTLRALSKIPEMAGYTQPGHSRRVAELAVAMAAELGAAEDELREIEYAALLHDIGRVVLEDPESPDAAAGLRADVATTGASIVAAAGTFPEVARMIREQHDPYRRPGEILNDEITMGARILRVANTFDDLCTGNSANAKVSPWVAIEALHGGAAYEYDPAVVSALARVLARDGVI